MANWFLFKQQTSLCNEILYHRKKDAEEARFIEYKAAVKIQAWYRGVRLRYYLKSLNFFATIIQRFWRGLIGRRLFRVILKKKVDIMCIKKYTDAATTIQKRWKGFYTRKYRFDYYKYKRSLRELETTNRNTIEFLNEYQHRTILENQLLNETKKYKEMVEWANKHHYLISTKVQPSIYNSPFTREHLTKEFLLKESQKNIIKTNKTDPKMSKTDEGFIYDPSCSMIIDKPIPTKRLPPLAAYAPQGPFRSPAEVRKQRYKPFNPSLRVMTDFESVEKAREIMANKEWTERVHDDIFYPVMNRGHRYEPMLVTTTEYGPIAYGTKQFRDDVKLEDAALPFKNIVPPIQTFDKLNNQYIENYSV